MRYRIWLAIMGVFSSCLPAWAADVDIKPLADCTVKVFNEISKSRVWSGKTPDGCKGRIYVEKRANGIFVTAWNSSSQEGWDRLSFSAAAGYFELADRKSLKSVERDISSRAGRMERCMNSILRVNDPLECRDTGKKTYLAGERAGVELLRQVWLDDNGRHSIIEYAYGDSKDVVAPPADLFLGPEMPPGTKLNIHVFEDTP